MGRRPLPPNPPPKRYHCVQIGEGGTCSLCLHYPHHMPPAVFRCMVTRGHKVTFSRDYCAECARKFREKYMREIPMNRWLESDCTPFLTGWRPAEVLSWYDADTPAVRIDLGFGSDVRPGGKGYIRLLAEGAVLTPDDKSDDGVDAWELRGDERPLGLAAKSRAMELIPEGSTVRVWSFKGKGATGKYGRWLCVILFWSDTAKAWLSLGDVLISEGHAERVTYG